VRRTSWESMADFLRQRLPLEEFEAWFAPLQPESTPGGGLTLRAPSQLYADYIRDHHGLLLAELAQAFPTTPVRIVVAKGAEGAQPLPFRPVERSPLNPRYTFASFIAGPSNQFARAAALSVAENPGQAYNPLFIYGGSGLGKTHLLHAVGNHIVAARPGTRVRYVATESFVNELINSIRLQRMPAFRETYRSVDVLLLDDVHIVAGKERTQEEFFHTFNALHEAGQQIVLTSDTPPAAIQGLEERLRSRFVWGLVADIQPPDLETKCAIIREKAHSEGVDLTDDVVLFIARRVRENVRELEGYLNRVLVFLSLTASPPNLETVRAALTPILPEERTVTPQEIVRFVAHHYGLKVSDLKGRDNRRSVAFPRQVAMYLIREVLGLSYPEIGKLFGKHHSTVIYSIETITESRRSNPSLDATLTTFAEHFR
jgi:chromosomal replication initiator protein